MRAIVQRVSSAAVNLPGDERRAIGPGLLIYLGVGRADDSAQACRLADKIAQLRIFSNAEGKFDKSLLDTRGEALVISQFTLFGNVKGGRRPDFTAAAPPDEARGLYARFAKRLAELKIPVATGEFAAHMLVESINDGPVTLWLDTADFGPRAQESRP